MCLLRYHTCRSQSITIVLDPKWDVGTRLGIANQRWEMHFPAGGTRDIRTRGFGRFTARARRPIFLSSRSFYLERHAMGPMHVSIRVFLGTDVPGIPIGDGPCLCTVDSPLSTPAEFATGSLGMTWWGSASFLRSVGLCLDFLSFLGPCTRALITSASGALFPFTLP